MPRYNIWIKKENVSKWKAVGNKSEWINALLDNSTDTREYGKTIDTPIGPAVTVLAESMNSGRKDTFIPQPPDPAKGYPCCQKATPCKHWVYDGLHEEWKNTITGEAKQI